MQWRLCLMELRRLCLREATVQWRLCRRQLWCLILRGRRQPQLRQQLQLRCSQLRRPEATGVMEATVRCPARMLPVLMQLQVLSSLVPMQLQVLKSTALRAS